MDQVVQMAGALAVLAAFMGAQLRKLTTDSWPYLWLNVAGATALTVVAALDSDWGFLLLESVWAVVSAFAIVQKLRPARD